RIHRRLLFRATTLVIDPDIAEGHIFNTVAWHPTDDRRVFWIGVVDYDVADDYPPQRAYFSRFLWSAEAGAQAQKKRRITDVAHGDVGNRYVFQQRAVHRFQGQAAAVVKHAV